MRTQVPRRERRRLEKLRRKHAKRLARGGTGPPSGRAPGPAAPAAPAGPLACRDAILAQAARVLSCWESSRGWLLSDPVGALCRAVGFAGAQAVSLQADDLTEAMAGGRLQLRLLRRETSPAEDPVRALPQDAIRARDLLAALDAAFDPGKEGAHRGFLDTACLALRSCYPADDPGKLLRDAECATLAYVLWTVLERRSPALVLHAARTLLWSTSDLSRRPRKECAPTVSEEDLSLLAQEGPREISEDMEESPEPSGAYEAASAAAASELLPAPP